MMGKDPVTEISEAQSAIMETLVATPSLWFRSFFHRTRSTGTLITQPFGLDLLTLPNSAETKDLYKWVHGTKSALQKPLAEVNTLLSSSPGYNETVIDDIITTLDNQKSRDKFILLDDEEEKLTCLIKNFTLSDQLELYDLLDHQLIILLENMTKLILNINQKAETYRHSLTYFISYLTEHHKTWLFFNSKKLLTIGAGLLNDLDVLETLPDTVSKIVPKLCKCRQLTRDIKDKILAKTCPDSNTNDAPIPQSSLPMNITTHYQDIIKMNKANTQLFIKVKQQIQLALKTKELDTIKLFKSAHPLVSELASDEAVNAAISTRISVVNEQISSVCTSTLSDPNIQTTIDKMSSSNKLNMKEKKLLKMLKNSCEKSTHSEHEMKDTDEKQTKLSQ